MNKLISVITVIFPENMTYFKDFIKSIKYQTYQDFQLIIFNDGVETPERYIDGIDFIIVEVPLGLTIAQNRTFMLQYLNQSNFDIAIFGDSDDYFPSNRIEINLRFLSEYDVVVNDTHLVDINGNSLIKNYFQLKNKTEINFSDIKNKNCCGLGNTAIHIKALPNNIEFDSDVTAVDWMLFSRMLIEGKKAIYTNDTYIYYRQHSLNAIGFKSITRDRLLKGISIKLNHYSCLDKEFGIFWNEVDDYKRLYQYCLDKVNFNNYFEEILSLNLQNPMWWEEIKTLKELNIVE